MLFILKFVLILSATINKINSKICQTLPPGIERLTNGIDITELDFIPVGIAKSNGFNHVIFELTCNTTKKWTNPVDPSKVYDIPDQIESIVSLPQGIMDFKLNIHKTQNDVKKSMSASLGIDYIPGFFSLSASYSQSQEAILNKNNIVIEMSAFVSAHQIIFKPFFQQNILQSVQEYINKLPNTYQENPSKYQEFLSTFGTHFLTSGYFGGFLNTKIEIFETYAKRTNERTIQAEASATFFGLIKLHGGYLGTTSQVSGDFKKNSYIHEAYYGGKADIFSNASSAYSKWLKTIEDNPWLFGGKFSPITQLLPEGKRRDSISQAIQVRLDKAYIQELILSLKYIPTVIKPGIKISKDALYYFSFLEQISGLREKLIPNHLNVISLGKRIGVFLKDVQGKLLELDKPPSMTFCALPCDKQHLNNKNNGISSCSYFQNYANFSIVKMNPKILKMI